MHEGMEQARIEIMRMSESESVQALTPPSQGNVFGSRSPPGGRSPLPSSPVPSVRKDSEKDPFRGNSWGGDNL